MNRAFSKIWILIIVILLITGGILAYQYWWVPKEAVTILTPAKGEIWRVGERVEIRWKPTDSTDRVDIMLIDARKPSAKLGKIWERKNFPDIGRAPITVPETSFGNTYQIYIGNEEKQGYSDLFLIIDEFTIVEKKGLLTLISPNGGEVWREEDTYTIKWSVGMLDKHQLTVAKTLMICLEGIDGDNNIIAAKEDWRSSGCSYVSQGLATYLIDRVSFEQKKYNWTIPKDVSDRFETPPVSYKIGFVVLPGPPTPEATEWPGVTAVGKSDSYFTIVGKEVKAPEQNTVLCRTQYSTSIGGRNEPIAKVFITVQIADVEKQLLLVFVTDTNGQVYVSFRKGTTYNITAIYGGVEKSAILTHHGEATLLVSIDPNEPNVADITFLQPLPLEK